MIYAVNFEEGFGFTTDVSKVLFMIETQLKVSCRTFGDMNQAYCYACRTYIEMHAWYGQQRAFPMPRLEDFAKFDVFESPAKVPFTVVPVNRFFALAVAGNLGYNAIFNGIEELAAFSKSGMVLNLQEFPNRISAEQWIWQQQMIPIMAMGAYIPGLVSMPIPGVGEMVPFSPPAYLPEANALEATFTKENGADLFDDMGAIYEKY